MVHTDLIFSKFSIPELNNDIEMKVGHVVDWIENIISRFHIDVQISHRYPSDDWINTDQSESLKDTSYEPAWKLQINVYKQSIKSSGRANELNETARLIINNSLDS